MNMRRCQRVTLRNCTQQLATTIRQQDNLRVRSNSAQLICVFMQITYYMSWLQGGSTSKGPTSTSLRLKVATWC